MVYFSLLKIFYLKEREQAPVYWYSNQLPAKAGAGLGLGWGWAAAGAAAEAGSWDRSQVSLVRGRNPVPGTCCLPASTLAGNWSQEPEPSNELKHSDIGHRCLKQ